MHKFLFFYEDHEAWVLEQLCPTLRRCRVGPLLIMPLPSSIIPVGKITTLLKAICQGKAGRVAIDFASWTTNHMYNWIKYLLFISLAKELICFKDLFNLGICIFPEPS